MNKKNERFIDLEQRINDYFLYCDAVNESKEKMVKPYTLSGLLCYIGVSRQEFEKISKTKRYQKLISRAKSKIEAFIEENALTGELSISAATNSLKYNFGWGDTRHADTDEAEKSIKIILDGDLIRLAE